MAWPTNARIREAHDALLMNSRTHGWVLHIRFGIVMLAAQTLHIEGNRQDTSRRKIAEIESLVSEELRETMPHMTLRRQGKDYLLNIDSR